MKILLTASAAALAAAIPLLGGDGKCDVDVATPSCCSSGDEGASLAVVRAPEPVFDETTGSIQVKTVFNGEVPEALPKLELAGDKAKGCDAKHDVPLDARERVIDRQGNIANVVVMVVA